MDAQPPNSRRSFLKLLPLGMVIGMLATVATAAFRFLKPLESPADEEWLELGPVAEMKVSRPIARKVTRDYVAGWARTREQHTVYVLANNQVVSAICPHEGCEVAWSEEQNIFACPCHDSNFTAQGARIDGPATRGLDPLPTRVDEGVLKIQYRYYPDNVPERITRG